MTATDALQRLREAYRGSGIEVRHCPDCVSSFMRWQLGSNGDDHFVLIAYGSTPEKLLGCLEARVRSLARNGH